MKSLIRNVFLLTIFTVAMNGLGYSQSRPSPTLDMRTIDSVEMPMSGPQDFRQSPAHLKALPGSQQKPMAYFLRDIAAGKMTKSSATPCSDTSGRYFLDKDPVYFYPQGTTRSADGSILASG